MKIQILLKNVITIFNHRKYHRTEKNVLQILNSIIRHTEKCAQQWWLLSLRLGIGNISITNKTTHHKTKTLKS